MIGFPTTPLPKNSAVIYHNSVPFYLFNFMYLTAEYLLLRATVHLFMTHTHHSAMNCLRKAEDIIDELMSTDMRVLILFLP